MRLSPVDLLRLSPLDLLRLSRQPWNGEDRRLPAAVIKADVELALSPLLADAIGRTDSQLQLTAETCNPGSDGASDHGVTRVMSE